jgi:hypothetical protein
MFHFVSDISSFHTGSSTSCDSLDQLVAVSYRRNQSNHPSSLPTKDGIAPTKDELLCPTETTPAALDKDEVNSTNIGPIVSAAEGQMRSLPIAAPSVTASGQTASSRTSNSQRSPKTMASPGNSAVGSTPLVAVGDSSFSLPEPTNLLDSSF